MRWKVKLTTPVNWDLKLKFFVLPAAPTPSYVVRRKWIRAVRVNEKLVPIAVSALSEYEVVIESRNLARKEREKITDMVVDYFGLHDAKELYEFMGRDPKLKSIRDRFYGFGRAGKMSMYVFEGIVKAVMQQQISFKVAERIAANIVERFGERVEFGELLAFDFPTPEKLCSVSVDELRKCGLSRRKAEVIKNISETALSYDFEKLKTLSSSEVMDFLTSFKGVGRWTAELVMSMVLGFNIIPADDLGVRRAISNLYFGGELQSSETVRKVAERFGEFARDILYYLFLLDRLGKS